MNYFCPPKDYVKAKRGFRRSIRRTKKTAGMFRFLKIGKKIRR